MSADARETLLRLFVGWGDGFPVRRRDEMLAALAAAGKAIVDVEGWEWGVRWPDGDWIKCDDEADAYTRLSRNHWDGASVVRRRPAGEWEPTSVARRGQR